MDIFAIAQPGEPHPSEAFGIKVGKAASSQENYCKYALQFASDGLAKMYLRKTR